MRNESYTIIETKPNGERVEHGIFWDLDACTLELERLCFSGKYPGSNWSFVTKWEGFDDEEIEDLDYEECPKCGKSYNDNDYIFQKCSKCGFDAETY